MNYPTTPGHKGTATSAEAAAKIDARKLQALVLAVLERGPRTADEIAEALGLSVLSIRPRVSELKAQGILAPTGERRPNQSGRGADVVRLVGAQGELW